MSAIELFKQIPGGWWSPGLVILLILLATNIKMFFSRCQVITSVAIVTYPVGLVMLVATGNDLYPACIAYLAATGISGMLLVGLSVGSVYFASWCYHTWNSD